MRIDEFIARFPRAKKTARGFTVNCPAHQDKTPSLDVDEGKDGSILLTCRSGNCTAEQIVTAMGLTLKDLFPDKDKPLPVQQVQRKTVATFIYRDESGQEVYRVDRVEPGRNGRKKEFFPSHVNPDGKRVWNLDGVRRVLYNLPELIACTDDFVFVVEGEGKADALMACDCVAVSAIGGAAKTTADGKSKWLEVYNDHFRGKHVVICPDNDKAGQEHAKTLYAALKPVAASIKFISVPLPDNDIKDYLPRFQDKDSRCRAIAALLIAAKPHPSIEHEKIRNMEAAERDYIRLCQDDNTPRLVLSRWLPSLQMRRIIPGEMVVIQAGTGVGKSLIAYNMVFHTQGLTSLVFQLELPEAITFERFGSMATDVSGEGIELTYQRGDSVKWRDSEELKRIWFCSDSGLSVQAMSQLVIESEAVIGQRPDIVVVDYIQLAAGRGKTAYEKTSDVAESLRVMAKNLNVIVIATSQIGRPAFKGRPGEEHDEAENMSYQPVSLSSGKNSGSVENSAAVVLGAWRSREDAQRMYIQPLKGTSGGACRSPIMCRVDPVSLRITEQEKIYGTDTDEI